MIIIRVNLKEENLLKKLTKMLYSCVADYYNKDRGKMSKILGVTKRTLRNHRSLWDD